MAIHKSKIDMWLMCFLGGMLLLPIMLAVIFGEGLGITLLMCGFTAILTLWLYMVTQYRITNDALIVHAGLYKVNIPIASIKSILKTNDAIASPAFSLDRLEIIYNQNLRVLMSPKDKAKFLADIGWPDTSLIAR